MKRIIVLFSIVVASIGSAMAEEVSSAVALRVASQIFGDTTRSTSLAVAWDSTDVVVTRAEETPTFYVVAPSAGRGFVIVAGDDAVSPILGYSTTYAMASAEHLPTNFVGWLTYIDSVVRYVRESGAKASDAVVRLWSEGYKPVGATMLNTARWSQLPPYNNHCPMDGDAHSLTGCTQTAMAIIMHHHRWPERAKGVTEAYTTMGGMYVPSRDLNHAYDWDSMLETYVEGEYSDKEADAVAVLMADLGYAFKAEYTALDTGAFPDMLALYEKFGYSPASNRVMRRDHSDEYWVSILRKEIESSRPIFYAGYTAEGSGHAFVIDGVDDNNYFHVNWGWGGLCDGFFMIDSLTLDQYLFDTQHWAVLGMHPMRDGEVDNWLSLVSTGLTISTATVERGVPFEINPIVVANYSQLHFSGDVRVGVCSASGELKSWASKAQRVDLPSMYGASCKSMSGVITEEIVVGDRLVVLYRSDSSEKWFKIQPYNESACAEVVIKYAPIGDTTSMSFDKATGLLVVDYDDDVKSALYMLNEFIETGVTITKGLMRVDTNQLQRDATYTIYLERRGVESKSIMFTLKGL
ncbi:MAG: C10 family peptidase [Alistipes sp.]|nr:C10 family peptidase [Alistipes sp.]